MDRWERGGHKGGAGTGHKSDRKKEERGQEGGRAEEGEEKE